MTYITITSWHGSYDALLTMFMRLFPFLVYVPLKDCNIRYPIDLDRLLFNDDQTQSSMKFHYSNGHKLRWPKPRDVMERTVKSGVCVNGRCEEGVRNGDREKHLSGSMTMMTTDT